MTAHFIKTYALILCAFIAGCQEHKTNAVKPSDPTAGMADSAVAKPIEDSIYLSEPTQSTLHGRLIQKLFYGPPGFGETPKEDAHYIFFVLVLNKPITYFPDPKSTFDMEYSSRIDHIDSIQIIAQRTNPKLFSHVGQPVTISGTLHFSVLPSEFTPVVLDFTEIK